MTVPSGSGAPGAGSVRVLSGVADPDTARALTGLLDQLPGVSAAATALPDSTSLLDALARAAEAGLHELPEVVVVHDRIAPTPASEVVREIALRFPAVGVVLLTADPSPAVLSGAMDCGARGVVGLPLSYDELGARVDAAATWAAGVRRHLSPPPGTEEPQAGAGGTLVAVAGAKGGVGTTVTAVQLALAACAAGQSVALVDMDLQGGDIASYLDVQFRRSVADLAGIGDITGRVLQDAMYVHQAGPALLIAPAEGERGEEVTDRSARQILYALRQRYQVVVVDCGTQMGGANAVAVETAQTAVLVTTPDVVAVRAAKRMVRMWDRLRIRKPLDTTVAVNRWTRGTEIQPSLIGRITGTRMATAVIPAAYRELQPVVDAGRLQDLDHRSTVRQGVRALAAELGLTAGEPLAPAPKALGRRGRMRRVLGAVGEGDRGQVTVETLGMTPIIVISLILVWQAVLAGYTFTLAGDAADEAARAAALGHDAAAAANADLPGAWQCGGCVSTSVHGDMVTATVKLPVPVLFPGAVDFPLSVPGHASAVVEEAAP